MLTSVLLIALCAAPVPPSAPATKQRWKLPPRSAVLFDRRIEHPEREGATARLEDDEVSDVPVLFASDLDAEGRGLRRPAESLHLLVRDLACHLEHTELGGRFEWTVPGSTDWDAHRIRALVRRPADDGSQEIVAEIRPSPRAGDGGRRRGMQAELEGTLRVTRWFDPHAGQLLRCRGRLEARLRSNAGEGRLVREEEWVVREIWQADSEAFRAEVRRAIDDGAAALHDDLEAMLEGGPRGRRPRDPDAEASALLQNGYLGLALLALQKSLAVPRTRTLAMARTELLRREIPRTYDLTCAILAIEALYTPERERENLQSGVLARPAPRELEPEHQERVDAWARELLRSLQRPGVYGDHANWGYTAEDGGWDHSNTQFAVLGLYAARLCGAQVPAAAFASIARHYLAERADAEDSMVALRVVGPRELSSLEAESAAQPRTVTQVRRRPRGWKYRAGQGEGMQPSGSMTAGAISSLAIARSVLDENRLRGAMLGEIDVAIDEGLAWLAEHWSVRANPGEAWTRSRHYYWLYSLERACELAGVALLQERDWYFEGATILLLERRPGGGWGRLTDDAFALLFLKRAVLGPTTQRR